MKIIHAADLHLGSALRGKFNSSITAERKQEIRQSFLNLIEYAKKEGVAHILLSGDIFDSDYPSDKDRNFFFEAIASHPQIEFYYLRGNHDLDASNDKNFANLHRFSSSWESYDLGEGVKVSGIELSEENFSSFYSTLSIDPDDFNIVMLHGQIANSVGKNNIVLKKLRDKNIDYLCLGHIHQHEEGEIDKRGSYAYPGCLEGRGFDETGEKGFIVLDTARRETRFVVSCIRKIVEVEVDVSLATSDYSAANIIRDAVAPDNKTIYRAILVGECPLEANFTPENIVSFLSDEPYYFIAVKDKTSKRIDVDSIKDELSLKGEFVRQVNKSEELSEEEKNEVLALGLKALLGKEID